MWGCIVCLCIEQKTRCAVLKHNSVVLPAQNVLLYFVGLYISSFLCHLTLVFQLLLLPCTFSLTFCGLGSPFLSKCDSPSASLVLPLVWNLLCW